MLRVYIAPQISGPDQADGGIRRVVEAQLRHLADYDVQPVGTPDEAELIACHGTLLVERPGIPLVAHNHGLYWHDYDWPGWAHEANRRCIDLMRRADAITAPSRWVAHAISRGMLAEPVPIYHGVDAGDWLPADESQGYVLWNKARADAVSDPVDMNALARWLPDVPFISTFGEPAPNVRLCGALPHQQMRELIRHAGVYLATARETFGIGTLEAMAAGVPVVGWSWGGQQEIIRHGETGYLAPPGDYAALAELTRRALAERGRLGANARADVAERWQWHDKIAQYAALYHQVAAAAATPRPKVSVVITSYNLARFLPDAVRSVQAQSLDDWECLIVDDGSIDETGDIGRAFHAEDQRITYHRPPQNLGLSAARDFGAARAAGRYLLFLDADDMLEPYALAHLSEALDRDRGLHIAYGGLDTVSEDGGNRQPNPWPPAHFDWASQLAHLNQLPYCAMLRREVLERAGGYRRRDWRAEDASLWARLTSFGFRAERVTPRATLIYRLRANSKGGTERAQHDGKGDPDGDWTAWLPWRLAGTARGGVAAIGAGAIAPHAHLTPWSAQGQPPRTLPFWHVRHHQDDLVTVIIPVGGTHDRYVIDALDSLVAQTYPGWRALVIDDTAAQALTISGAPYARIIRTGGGRGPGYARNQGLHAADTPLVLFLDADDYLLPRALELMITAYVNSGGRYIYTDGWHDDGRQVTRETAPDYCQEWWRMGGQHAVTVLTSREQAIEVGGFDSELAGMEDLDFFIRCAISGVCGERLDQALFVYRQHTGQRRRAAGSQGKKIAARYAAYSSGEKQLMACCGGTDAGQAILRAKGQLERLAQERLAVSGRIAQTGGESGGITAPTKVLMRYTGGRSGIQPYSGAGGRTYVGGNSAMARYAEVHEEDVPLLLRTGDWQAELLPVAQPDESAAAAEQVPQVTREYR